MEKYHPMDPSTNKKFPFDSKVTVKDYYAKLSDVCCCYEIYIKYKELKKYIKKKYDSNDIFVKPESLNDIPSSDDENSSSEEDNPTAKGLSLTT